MSGCFVLATGGTGGHLFPAEALANEFLGGGSKVPRPGEITMAHLGVLFLDEIADLDLGLQSKLLHFLQDGFFSRLGDQAERAVDTRVICATGRRLDDESRLRAVAPRSSGTVDRERVAAGGCGRTRRYVQRRGRGRGRCA